MKGSSMSDDEVDQQHLYWLPVAYAQGFAQLRAVPLHKDAIILPLYPREPIACIEASPIHGLEKKN